MNRMLPLSILEGDEWDKRGVKKGAGEARKAVEKRTGKTVITDKNAIQLQDLVTGLIETGISENKD